MKILPHPSKNFHCPSCAISSCLSHHYMNVHTVEHSITIHYMSIKLNILFQSGSVDTHAVICNYNNYTWLDSNCWLGWIQWSLISHSVDQPSKSLRRPLDWDRHLDGPALLAVPGLLPQGFSGFSEGAIWVRFRLVGFTLHWMSCNLKCVTWPATWLRWWYLIYTHSRHLQTCCRNLAIYG